MALTLAGEKEGLEELIESIQYEPLTPDSGDLEAATNTITATTEPVAADYSVALTLPAPGDSRLQVKRQGYCLDVTVDSATAGTLYFSVRKQGGSNFFTGSWTIGTPPSSLADALADGIVDPPDVGQAVTYEIRFWVDAGNAVLSKVQLRSGVGAGGTSTSREVLRITAKGLLELIETLAVPRGTGQASFRFLPDGAYYLWEVTGNPAYIRQPTSIIINPTFEVSGTVATDLVNCPRFILMLRRIV